MNKRLSVRAGFVVAAFVTVAAAGGHAYQGQSNYVSFSKPVALPGVVLPAGAYRFEVVDTSSSANVVRVAAKDDNRTYFMHFTMPIERPANLKRGQAITFGESAGGTPPPIAAWYPIGSARGHRFIYQ